MSVLHCSKVYCIYPYVRTYVLIFGWCGKFAFLGQKLVPNIRTYPNIRTVPKKLKNSKILLLTRTLTVKYPRQVRLGKAYCRVNSCRQRQVALPTRDSGIHRFVINDLDLPQGQIFIQYKENLKLYKLRGVPWKTGQFQHFPRKFSKGPLLVHQQDH